MSSDYYPDDHDVETIKNWDYKSPRWQYDLMEFIKNRWWMADWGWSEEEGVALLDTPVHRYSISTGGWSGNEILIDALESNYVFWMLCWVQTRRGGHYIFEIRKEGSETYEEFSTTTTPNRPAP